MNDERPLPPGDYDCCESGCDRCVWDIYRADVAEWEAEQKGKKGQQKCPSQQDPPSPKSPASKLLSGSRLTHEQPATKS